MLNKYIKCNFRSYWCGTSSIVDIRRLKFNHNSTWTRPSPCPHTHSFWAQQNQNEQQKAQQWSTLGHAFKASRKHDSVIERIYFFSLPIQSRNIRSIVKYTAEDDTTNRLKKRMNWRSSIIIMTVSQCLCAAGGKLSQLYCCCYHSHHLLLKASWYYTVYMKPLTNKFILLRIK